MDTKDERLIEQELAKAIPKLFKQLMHDLEKAPSLILESGDLTDGTDQTMREVSLWLFRRRQKNGCRDDKADN